MVLLARFARGSLRSRLASLAARFARGSLRSLRTRLTSLTAAYPLPLRRLESLHNIEMDRARKCHGQQMDRFRLQHTAVNGGGTVTPGRIKMGVAGPRKAFEASNLPLDQYLLYLEKFQQDTSVLTTLSKNNNI